MKYSSFINLGKNYLWDRMADERYCNKAVMCILSYYACDTPMMQFLGALKRVIFHTGLIFHQCFCICILYISNQFNECKMNIYDKATSLQMWICTHHTNDWFLDGQIIHQFECECYICGRWLQIFLWHSVIWLDLNSPIWQGSQWSWRLDTNWLG